MTGAQASCLPLSLANSTKQPRRLRSSQLPPGLIGCQATGFPLLNPLTISYGSGGDGGFSFFGLEVFVLQLDALLLITVRTCFVEARLTFAIPLRKVQCVIGRAAE